MRTENTDSRQPWQVIVKCNDRDANEKIKQAGKEAREKDKKDGGSMSGIAGINERRRQIILRMIGH